MKLNKRKNVFLISQCSICLFFLFQIACTDPKNNSNNKPPVFSEEIAPIIYKNCTPCHRPGSGAPFNLITYDDIKKHLHTLQFSVNERLMPPWPADTSYSHFRDEKVLTKEELLLLNKWIDDGAALGDISRIPKPPEYFNQSRFGKPDMVLRMRQPFIIKGDNKDNFIMLKIPYELPRDTFIRGEGVLMDYGIVTTLTMSEYGPVGWLLT